MDSVTPERPRVAVGSILIQAGDYFGVPNLRSHYPDDNVLAIELPEVGLYPTINLPLDLLTDGEVGRTN